MLKQYKLRFYNFRLIIFLLAISLIGVTLVGTAAENLKSKQFAGVILGLIIMVILSLMDYSWIMNFQWFMYGFNIIMLIVVRIAGSSANGAARWIGIGSFRFQPTELSKIILIVFFAKFFMDHEENLNTLKTLAASAGLLAVPLILILEQPDLKNTLTVIVIFCMMIYIAGLSYKVIGGALLISVPLLIIFLSIVVQPDQKLLKDYQQKRILAFLEPEKYESDEAYQQKNSVMAIGSGQLTGKGLNNNTTTSVKNGNFISEPQTDFIFAIVGEELGFVGSCIVVALLLLIVIQCILVGIRSQDLAGRIICCGVGGLIGFQSFINIGVASKLLPNTGVPLPFVSYGLTSLVSLYVGIGFVLNVGLQPKKYQ